MEEVPFAGTMITWWRTPADTYKSQPYLMVCIVFRLASVRQGRQGMWIEEAPLWSRSVIWIDPFESCRMLSRGSLLRLDYVCAATDLSNPAVYRMSGLQRDTMSFDLACWDPCFYRGCNVLGFWSQLSLCETRPWCSFFSTRHLAQLPLCITTRTLAWWSHHPRYEATLGNISTITEVWAKT